MTPQDQEKLEEITADFTRSLIKNKMEDTVSYLELCKRLALLVDMEIKWQVSLEETRTLMATWGPLVN